MPTGVVSSSSPFTFLFHRFSLSYPLLYSAAIRQERFTRPDIRLHTFETCVNGGREATATGVRFSRINRTLENFTLALLRERRYVAPSRRRKEEEEVRDVVYV